MASWPIATRPLELWAGPECTVRRVSDSYSDQIELTGHARRVFDLDRFASLGITALRYPVLWERTWQAGWAWPDERLGRLRELGIRPIVGLVHHGSGPPSTSLVDPAFPTKLAAYACAVAKRYPWVEDWTPVNEPLTTARFSGLYGHWYPHGQDAATFVRALLVQVRGVVEAMAAIRKVVPAARLVQTDDLGKTFSTPPLKYQADYENERRWLTWDLLCGRVDQRHPLWQWLIEDGGATPDELDWFGDHACPPDVIGINHYLSSERFLDERTDRYPGEPVGGNGRDQYVDVLAARVSAEGPAGPEVLLREAWERFRLPLAVTEVHNGCTREEQLRWLVEVWTAAQARRADGDDVCAVTLWSLLGAVGWDTMLTGSDSYEPGVWDLRSPEPRETVLVGVARQLSAGQVTTHPVVGGDGWWRRPDRLFYEPIATGARPAPYRAAGPQRPLLVVGTRGTLGQAFARACESRGLAYVPSTREHLDIADRESVTRALVEVEPWAIVNAAGYVDVDAAEADQDRCFRENVRGPATLAAACADHRIQLLTFSSDLVFSGEQEQPYVESDPTGPLNVYGASKAQAEQLVLASYPEALIIRTSAFFGPWDDYNFIAVVWRDLARTGRCSALGDVVVSPTYVPSLVDASLDLLIDGEAGIWHLANDGAVTWAELARIAATRAGFHADCIEEVMLDHLVAPAARPRFSVLGSQRGQLLPRLETDLEMFFRAARGAGRIPCPSLA